LLKELTQVAITYEPAEVGEIALELFSYVIGECYQEQAFETASLFFGCLIVHVRSKSPAKLRRKNASVQILRWLPADDPLRISQDPECGYSMTRR
jgi:hypothetical protein